MNGIETPQGHAGEAVLPTAEDAVPTPPIMENASTPEVAQELKFPPRDRARKPLFVAPCALAVAGLCGIGYWKRASLPATLDLIPPYSSAIAFVSLGIIGAFYKDKYRNHAAKWAAVIMMVVFGFLMGLNTYRDRAVRAQEKADRAREKIENAKTSDSIIKSVDHISGELKDFKDKVKPDEIRSDMSGLRATMEKVLHPPQATLLFTFAPFNDAPVDGGPAIPVRDITLPIKPEGSVHVRLTFLNNTDVRAEGLQVSLDICTSCKFAKEPDGFTRVAGSRETERHHLYGDMPPRGAYAELALDIIPPPGVGAFDIKAVYRCKTCILEAAGTIGRIHLQRN